MPLTLELQCVFCPDTAEVPLETDWGARHDSVCDGDALCPKHKGVLAFLEAQCPGCVGAFNRADCPLLHRIARSEGPSRDDMDIVLSGRCPSRVGGTYLQEGRGAPLEKIDLSDVVPPEGAQAMHDAIVDLPQSQGG